jgi:hypothetical protein
MSEQLELTAVSLLARGRFVISLAITIESVSIEAYTAVADLGLLNVIKISSL